MIKRLIPLCLSLAGPFFVAGSGHAQTRVDIRSQSKSVDFSDADSTKPFKMGTSLPESCSAGEVFLKTDAPPGANLYLCLANEWSLSNAEDDGLIAENQTCSSAVETAYTLVKSDTANPGAILPVHTGDVEVYGVAVSTCATGGTVKVARFGRVQCVADANGGGVTTPGNAALISTTLNGSCMDSRTTAAGVGNLTHLVGIIQNSAATGELVTVVLTPWEYGTRVMQSTLPAPYSGWQSNAVLSGGGQAAPPVVTSVTIDEANNISTPGALNTGSGSGSAGSIVALRGTGMARLGVQGETSGEWDITAPANFSSWSFTPPPAPCDSHQWMTTDSGGTGGCTRPALADLSDASTLAQLGTSQEFTGANSFTGSLDASGAAHTIPAKVGMAASKPATCKIGEMYFATDVTAGQNWYYCTAADTWSQQLNSGAGGAGGAFIGGTLTSVGASSTLCGMPFGGTSASYASACEWSVPAPGTLKNLVISTKAAGVPQPASGSLVCTIHKNSSATSLAVTFAAGSAPNSATPSYQADTTHSVSLAAGDSVSLRCVNSATATATQTISWGASIQ